MTLKEVYAILKEIEDHVEDTCCAITMEPDDVLVLINKLRQILTEYKKKHNENNK